MSFRIWLSRGRARRRAALAVLIACGLTIVLVLDHILPLRAYRAYCPGRDIWIEGPFRERFLWLVSQDLWRFDLEHFIYKGNIYQFGWGGNDLYWKLFGISDDYHLNMDWKFASGSGGGVTLDGAWFPPPPRVVELVRAAGAEHSLSLRHDERGAFLHGPTTPFRDDCELFKAAILPDAAFGKPPAGARSTVP
jgi:hypothetical protein